MPKKQKKQSIYLPAATVPAVRGRAAKGGARHWGQEPLPQTCKRWDEIETTMPNPKAREG